MSLLIDYFRDFTHLLFPFNCLGCGAALDENENPVCEHCREDLPVTTYWRQQGNSVEKLFWGKIPVEHASAFAFFKKGNNVQRLMHALKYRGHEEVGEILGQWYGEALRETSASEVDVIVPVPLHNQKRKQRGYNQCDSIARGLARVIQRPVISNAVVRLRYNESQTTKGVYERWLNVKELFRVEKPSVLTGRHVLLVDDVVTTGSTLEACAGAILAVPGCKVSVATLACPAPY